LNFCSPVRIDGVIRIVFEERNAENYVVDFCHVL